MRVLMSAARSLRQTNGSFVISGEVQITRILLRASGAVISRRRRLLSLLVATSTCLFATAMSLASCEALRTVLKQVFGSMFLAAKIYEIGTRKPEVEFGSPMPKFNDLSHFSTSSRFCSGESLCTMRCDQ